MQMTTQKATMNTTNNINNPRNPVDVARACFWKVYEASIRLPLLQAELEKDRKFINFLFFQGFVTVFFFFAPWWLAGTGINFSLEDVGINFAESWDWLTYILRCFFNMLTIPMLTCVQVYIRWQLHSLTYWRWSQLRRPLSETFANLLKCLWLVLAAAEGLLGGDRKRRGAV